MEEIVEANLPELYFLLEEREEKLAHQEKESNFILIVSTVKDINGLK